ncbi:MAG: response regulator transcription factor, partial [Bacteroidota bacterium]
DKNEKIVEALKAGAKGYILKKDGTQGAIDGVRLLHQGGSLMNSYIARKVCDSFDELGKRGTLTETLSNRELQVLDLLAEGLSNKEIAAQLKPQVSYGTVAQTLNNIYKKLEVNNRTEAARIYHDR